MKPPAEILTDTLLREAQTRGRGAAGQFRLPLRQRVWKGGAGDFMGRGTGASLDFQDHRAYMPGDDPRHINWQAYARTGQYTMKVFREEVRPLIDIVLDVSGSMFFEAAKAARALELFYFAMEAAVRAGAPPQVWLVGPHKYETLPLEAAMAGRGLVELAGETTAAAAVPAFARVPLRGNSLRVVISDLLFAGDPDPLAAFFASRQGRPVLLAPWCRAEAEPDWDGNMEFIDSETRAAHPRRVEPALLRRYREAYARHFGLWQSAALRHGLLLARVPADPPLTTALREEAVRSGAVEIPA